MGGGGVIVLFSGRGGQGGLRCGGGVGGPEEENEGDEEDGGDQGFSKGQHGWRTRQLGETQDDVVVCTPRACAVGKLRGFRRG